MRRAKNPWDRFYRYHEAPWRGERDLEVLAPYLADPVLELGVGNGKALRPVLRAGHRVLALDVSWHALRRLNHADCVLADAGALPIGDASMGTVLDIHCGGHLDAAGRARLAADTARVLAPGGYAVVERLGTGDLRATQGQPVEGDPESREVQDGRRTWFASEQSLRALFASTPLAVVDARTESWPVRMRDASVRRETVRLVLRRDP